MRSENPKRERKGKAKTAKINMISELRKTD